MTKVKAENMTGGIKLNYAVPKVLDDALTEYCEATGRTASDVIRQLLAEYIDGDRTLSSSAQAFSGDIRSNMILPKTLRTLLDEKIAADGEVSRGAVIVRLLYDFLEHKVELNEAITITVDRDLYKRLYYTSQNEKKSIEEIILAACDAYTKDRAK